MPLKPTRFQRLKDTERQNKCSGTRTEMNCVIPGRMPNNSNVWQRPPVSLWHLSEAAPFASPKGSRLYTKADLAVIWLGNYAYSGYVYLLHG